MVNIHYLGTFSQGFIDFAREAVAALRNAGASAYQYWSDVAEEDVVKILEQFKARDL